MVKLKDILLETYAPLVEAPKKKKSTKKKPAKKKEKTGNPALDKEYTLVKKADNSKIKRILKK